MLVVKLANKKRHKKEEPPADPGDVDSGTAAVSAPPAQQDVRQGAEEEAEREPEQEPYRSKAGLDNTTVVIVIACAVVCLAIFGYAIVFKDASTPRAPASSPVPRPSSDKPPTPAFEELMKVVERGDIGSVKELIAKGADVNARGDKNQTPLHRAAARGRIRIMKLLIDRGANVNARTKAGWTPMHEAAWERHTEAVKLLIDRGANINAPNDNGATPLSVAQTNEMKELLKKHGAKAPVVKVADGGSKVNGDKAKAIPLRAGWQRVTIPNIGTIDMPPTMEVQSGILKTFGVAMRKGVGATGSRSTDFIIQQKGLNEGQASAFKLHALVTIHTGRATLDLRALLTSETRDELAECSEKVKNMMEGRKAAVLAATMSAAKRKIQTMSDAELKELWRLHFKGRGQEAKLDRLTPATLEMMRKDLIQVMSEQGKAEGIRFLQWHPARAGRVSGRPAIRVGFRTQQGQNPPNSARMYMILDGDKVHVVTFSYREAEKERWAEDLRHMFKTFRITYAPAAAPKAPLRPAAAKRDAEVEKVLLDKGMDVNARDENGNTPLHLAAWKGHTARARALLDKGADVGAESKNGSTPLFYAATKGHTDAAKLLLDKGADVGARNELGWTPLHYATSRGHVDIARLLIDKGANVNAKAENGKTPLDYAVNRSHWELADLLRKHGAIE